MQAPARAAPRHRSTEARYRAGLTAIGTRSSAAEAEAHLYSLLSVIPPGRHYTSVPGGWGAMTARPAVEISFTDRSGVHWLRSADGTLREIDRPPVEHYGIEGPYDWQLPEPS
jgi:hypothetical protein